MLFPLAAAPRIPFVSETNGYRHLLAMLVMQLRTSTGFYEFWKYEERPIACRIQWNRKLSRKCPSLLPMPSHTFTHCPVRSDIKLATLAQSAPILPFDLQFEMPYLPIPNANGLLPSLGRTLIQNWDQISDQVHSIQILHDMIMMTRYTEAVFKGLFPQTKDDAYYDYFNFQNLTIEYRLLSFKEKEGSSRNTAEKTPVTDCCYLACLLFVNTVLCCGYLRSSAIIRHLVQALKLSLEGSTNLDEHVESPWLRHDDTMFWVLYIGTFCSHGEAEGDFFAERLRAKSLEMGISSVEKAEILLQNFLYVERIHRHRLRETLTRVG